MAIDPTPVTPRPPAPAGPSGFTRFQKTLRNTVRDEAVAAQVKSVRRVEP
jgi:hypothetical protein